MLRHIATALSHRKNPTPTFKAPIGFDGWSEATQKNCMDAWSSAVGAQANAQATVDIAKTKAATIKSLISTVIIGGAIVYSAETGALDRIFQVLSQATENPAPDRTNNNQPELKPEPNGLPG